MSSSPEYYGGHAWLWNLSSQDAEPIVMANGTESDTPDTKAGAQESEASDVAPPLKPFAKYHTTPRVNGISPQQKHEPALSSSRTSIDMENEEPKPKPTTNATSGMIVNQTMALDEEEKPPSRQSTLSSRQSRMGSMTRRLSQLGIGKKNSKDKVRSTIDTVAE